MTKKGGRRGFPRAPTTTSRCCSSTTRYLGWNPASSSGLGFRGGRNLGLKRLDTVEPCGAARCDLAPFLNPFPSIYPTHTNLGLVPTATDRSQALARTTSKGTTKTSNHTIFRASLIISLVPIGGPVLCRQLGFCHRCPFEAPTRFE